MRTLIEIEKEFNEAVIKKVINNDFDIKEKDSFKGYFSIEIDTLEIKAYIKENNLLFTFRGRKIIDLEKGSLYDQIKDSLMNKDKDRLKIKIVNFSSIVGRKWDLRQILKEIDDYGTIK